MSAPPSKQLSANAPEFIPRGLGLNIIHNITNYINPQQGNFHQQQQSHHPQQQQQPHHQQSSHHHHHQHHHHHHQTQQQQQQHHHRTHHGQSGGPVIRDMFIRLDETAAPSTHSVQDRLQVNRGQQQPQFQPMVHPQPHQYNNMQNQQFSGRGGGSGSGGGYNKHHQHYNNSQQPQRYSNGGQQQQHRHSSHSSNSNATNNQQQPQQQAGRANSRSASTDPNQQTEEETFAVNYVESLINCLNENPGSFDSITASALTVFEGFGANEYILSNAMEMIFNRSIEEQNFRYMGAKLYGLLDLIDLRDDSSFRMLLNMKLKYHRNEMKYMVNEQSKVRGTTLFLAELYMQLRNDGNRIQDIAQNIVFCINQLLLKTTPENMKCICLSLKLAGYDLEFDCAQDMNSIINTLKTLTDNVLDVSTTRILENVIALQMNKWGRKSEPTPIVQSYNNTNSVRMSDDPVFYGPDGQIVTEEEAAFLAANLAANTNDADPDPYDSDLDSEMDAETKKAYRSFVKETNQHL